MRKLFVAAALSVFASLLVISSYQAQRDLRASLRAWQAVTSVQLNDGDILNRPGFEGPRDEVQFIQRLKREADVFLPPQDKHARSKANQSYEELKRRVQIEESSIAPTIATLKAVGQAGGFSNTDIYPGEFWHYAKTGAKREALVAFQKAKEFAAQGAFNMNEITRVCEAVEIAGGYKAVGLTPQEIEDVARLSPTQKIGLILDTAINAGTFMALLSDNLQSNMKSVGTFITSGFETQAAAAARTLYFAQEAQAAFNRLTPSETQEPLRAIYLDAAILSAGGLEKAGLSKRDYQRALNKPFLAAQPD